MENLPNQNVPSLAPSDNGLAPPRRPATPDLFTDLGALRISQDFGASVGVKKALLTVPIKKPEKEWFVRTNRELRIETCVLELKENREVYLVAPTLWPELASESTFGPRALYAAMNRQNVLLVWPIRLPGPDGKIDDWNRSALEAASIAESQWVRVVSNMPLGAYDVFYPTADWPEPDWPGAERRASKNRSNPGSAQHNYLDDGPIHPFAASGLDAGLEYAARLDQPLARGSAGHWHGRCPAGSPCPDRPSAGALGAAETALGAASWRSAWRFRSDFYNSGGL
jgi:hypothetical protein